jgi:palmitoyltransferase
MGIASRCRRCCAAVETVGDAFLRSVGPCYVLLGFGLVFSVAYSLLCVVLPLTRDLRTWQGLGTFAAVAFVFFNIGFNYVMSVRTDPGSPTQRDVQVMCAEAGAAVRRWCDKCRCPKPDLTHHCSVCKRCVLRMDHHCPWIHNCVGHRNYRYFFNFLFWLWCGCMVTVWHTGGEALGDGGISVFGLTRVGGAGAIRGDGRIVFGRLSGQGGQGGPGVPGGRSGLNADGVVRGGVRFAEAAANEANDVRFVRRSLNRDERSAATFACLLAVSVFLAMCGLWFWHVYLVLTAQTSIDYHYFAEKRREAKKRGEHYQNPHDLGWRRNWQDVFDERTRNWWWLWAMPRFKPHRGTGVPIVVEA